MNAVAVGTTAQNSSILDMAGYDSVMFVASFGTITDGTPKIKAQQDTVVGFGGAADLLGTGNNLAATDDNKVAILDLQKPLEQFVRCVIDRTIGSPATGCVIDGIIAIQYNARSVPTTQDTTVASAERHVAPIEGTA